MANTLVKLSEIETSLAQQEAGIQVNIAGKKTLLAEQAACKALCDEQSWTSTRLTTINTRSKKKDTKLAGVRRAVSEKEVKVAVAKKKDVQQEEAGNLIKLSENQKQKEIDEARSMVDTLVKNLE